MGDGDAAFTGAGVGGGDIWPDETRQRIYEALAAPQTDRASGLVIDTEPKRCATCRRELKPWQVRCPDDGMPVAAAEAGQLD